MEEGRGVEEKGGGAGENHEEKSLCILVTNSLFSIFLFPSVLLRLMHYSYAEIFISGFYSVFFE